MTLTAKQIREVKKVLTKQKVHEVFESLREQVRTAYRPSFEEIDAVYDPILDKLAAEVEEQHKYAMENGRYPWGWQSLRKNARERAEREKEQGKQAESGTTIPKKGKGRPRKIA